MHPAPICRTILILVSAVTVVKLAGAQTLERRPSPVPASSGSITAPDRRGLPSAHKLVLAQGTGLQVEIARPSPMKEGAIEGQLLYPIYVQGRLAIPKDTLIRGQVVALEPDMKARWHGRLLGDFTPFHTAKVRFDEIVLPSGPLPVVAATAAAGAPVLKLTAPGIAPNKSFISREWAQAKIRIRDRADWFTAPGFGDRALQSLYHQLPYHPERIAAHTAWSLELSAPLVLPGPLPAAADPSQFMPRPGQPETWAVHALLIQELTSARARRGDPVHALVVEPVYDKEKQLVVPQGSMLIGKVTAAKAARSFGRNGKLRFAFEQVRFPEGAAKPVQGDVAGATAEKAQDLQMDAEGTVTPRSQSSAIAPMLLTVLAGRALDEDGNLTADTGVASNGFGLVGRVVGVVAGNRNLAAGIGFYAAGLSFYENFLRTGRDVVFTKDTRIEIETTPLRAPLLKPEGQ